MPCGGRAWCGTVARWGKTERSGAAAPECSLSGTAQMAVFTRWQSPKPQQMVLLGKQPAGTGMPPATRAGWRSRESKPKELAPFFCKMSERVRERVKEGEKEREREEVKEGECERKRER